MFNSSKSPFKSFAAAMRLGGQQQNEAEPEVVAEEPAAAQAAATPADPLLSDKLKSMIADIEAGDAKYEARRAALQEQRRAAAEAAKKAGEDKPASPDISKPTATSAPAAASSSSTSPGLPEHRDGGFVEAQQLAAEQRKAAEALLLEACVLEERLSLEANAAKASSEFKVAKEKADGAAILEQQAKELAQSSAERHSSVVLERKEAENLAGTCRVAVDTAISQVTQLEMQLEEAKRVAEETRSMLQTNEQRVAECAAREATAEREVAEASGRVASCQTARETADQEARVAQERADSLKSALPSLSANFASIDDVRKLAARIAEQAATSLKQ
jgi:hypothetical protein